MDDLRKEPPRMTPDRFAKFFADFKYKFFDDIQTPEAFLASETGDCDDYATLADLILREKGYQPRLFAVRMPGLTHVVCFVTETKNYLDYNNRIYIKRTESSDGTLPDIARRVAKSFDASWTSVSEFTYSEGVKRLVTTFSKVGSATPVPAPAVRPTRKIVIDF
jgi:hypothetical protein